MIRKNLILRNIIQFVLSLLLISSCAEYTKKELPVSGELAFLAIHNNYWQVWLMQSDGSHARAITNTPYDKSRISWYPGHNELLVSGNQGELVKLSLNKRIEIPVKLPFEGVNDAVVSPNGKYIAFSQLPKGSVYNKMWLMDVASGRKTKVGWTKGYQNEPNFSPDSKTLYYLSGNNQQSHDIMKYNINTRSTEPVTVAKLYNLDVVPYGNNKMAFSSNRSGNYEIWIRDGRKVKQLTNHSALDGRPSWSADGKRIYFESSRGGSLDIWSMDVEGEKKPVQITHNKEGARHPLWRNK